MIMFRRCRSFLVTILLLVSVGLLHTVVATEEEPAGKAPENSEELLHNVVATEEEPAAKAPENAEELLHTVVATEEEPAWKAPEDAEPAAKVPENAEECDNPEKIRMVPAEELEK